MDFDDLPQPEREALVPPEELSTDGQNPNSMDDSQFGLLCDRMRNEGWLGGPILVDSDLVIADGEHRMRASIEIGLEEVPIRQYDFSDSDRRMVRLEMNKNQGEHDDKRDALEYDYLLDNGMADEVQSLTNAADEDLDELLAEIKLNNESPVQYDYDPEHNVYFEDCVEGMRNRLDDNSVDMVFTSPPYNKEKEGHNTKTSSTVEYSDNRTDTDYREFMGSVFSELARVVKPEGHIFINHQNSRAEGVIQTPNWIPELFPLPWRSYIVWDKGNKAMDLSANRNGRFYETWEPLFHFSDSPRPLEGSANHSVWEIDRVAGSERGETSTHPAPFPKALPEHALKATTDTGDLILDPFMGSGTTAVAAIQNDRDYVGFELDEEGAYKPIVERRIGEAKRQKQSSQNTSTTDSDSEQTDEATADD